jgi:glycogen(starch) synthase
MKIVIVGMGGVTTTFRNWPERVIGRALVERGHVVTNIAFYDPTMPALSNVRETIDGITVRRVPIRHAPNHVLRAALNDTGPFDIMYLLHPRNVLAYGAMRWAKRHGVPTVYTWNGPFHDRYLIDDRERPYDETPHYDRLVWNMREVARRTLRNGDLRDHLRNYWLHWPLRAADMLMPLSEHEGEIMRMMGLPQPQVVVHQWVDVESIRATLPADGPPNHDREQRLLFIGQLTPRKGYDLVVHALPHVVVQFPNARLQIVSGLNHADRAAMEQMARELGVEEHVTFLGRVDDSELVNLFRNATVYVTPTRYEGFGLTLLEAMAAGCPIVTSDIPVVREIIEHGRNGWLTPYNDSEGLAQGIVRLLGDAPLRQTLVAGGMAALRERFDEKQQVARIEAVFEEAVALHTLA